jgi:RimJ/RimL family protein N-acetyltransferase
MTTIELLQPDDHEIVAAWLSRPGINRWLSSGWRGKVVGARALTVAAMNPRNRFLLIRYDGTPVGLVALGDIDTVDGSALIWYLLGRDDLGAKGLVTEGVRQVIQFGFQELGLRTLSASVVQPNEASRRVLEKVGFRLVGTLRQGLVLDKRPVDRVIYDLLPEDLLDSEL